MTHYRSIVPMRPAARSHGSSSLFYRFIPLSLLSFVAVASSWGTYVQFYVGLTLVTIPLIVVSFFVILDLLFSRGMSRLQFFDLYILCFLGLIFFSRFWSLYPQAWPSSTLWYMVCVAAYFSCRVFVYDAISFKLIALSSMLGSVIGVNMIGQVTNEWGMVDDRMGIDGVNQNLTSYVLAGSICLSIIYLKYFTNRIYIRMAIAAYAVYITYYIFSLGTRGALISVILMALWLGVSRVFRPKFAGVMSLTAFLVCFLFGSGLLDGTLEFFDGLSNRGTGDLAGRMPVWQIARSFILDHLLTGVGAGAFEFLNPMQIGAHNFFLALLLDAGLLGFVSILMLLFMGFAPAMRPDAHDADKFVLGLFTAYFLPIATSGRIELIPFTWIVLALTFSLLNIRQERVSIGDRRFRHG